MLGEYISILRLCGGGICKCCKEEHKEDWCSCLGTLGFLILLVASVAFLSMLGLRLAFPTNNEARRYVMCFNEDDDFCYSVDAYAPDDIEYIVDSNGTTTWCYFDPHAYEDESVLLSCGPNVGRCGSYIWQRDVVEETQCLEAELRDGTHECMDWGSVCFHKCQWAVSTSPV